MDILAARKKAAERLQEQKQPEQEAQPVPPAAASAADQIVESPGPAGTVPESQPPAPAADAEAQTARDTAAGTAPVAEGPAEAASEQQVQQVQEIEMLSFRLGGEEYALMVEKPRVDAGAERAGLHTWGHCAPRPDPCGDRPVPAARSAAGAAGRKIADSGCEFER
jgi:hypothetical protein